MGTLMGPFQCAHMAVCGSEEMLAVNHNHLGGRGAGGKICGQLNCVASLTGPAVLGDTVSAIRCGLDTGSDVGRKRYS